ncbi:MAG: Ig-like domain-containing protein [Patescibacteria group bacterium]|jgi:cysteine-rich repeat protein
MRRFTALLFLFVSLFAGAVLFSSHPALAQVDTGLAEVGQTVNLSSTDPRVIATNIINVALGLVAIILVTLLIYAGFVWMTAGGDDAKVAQAKKIILSAVIGLLIILSAWAIARFVIERLLQATQGPGGGTSQGGGGSGGGFGGGGSSNAFQVKSITPQGNLPIRNVQVKILFSRPVDEATATAILVTQGGGTTVAGTLTVNNSVVTFVPSAPCPAPNAALFCFDADTDYNIQIGASLRSTQGQSLVCGGFAPACSAAFRTGNLIDTQDPNVSVIDPQDGQGVPADSLVTVRASATDDSAVSYIEFSDNGTVIDQAASSASSSQSFTGEVQWDTAGIPLQSVRNLVARAFDIDAHDRQSAAVSVVIRAPSCFNGVLDGDETEIDCGGTPNTPGFCGACSGGSCTANSQCSSGVCQSGTCVVQPTIMSVAPLDGQPDTFVTLQGLNFGTTGQIRFLGAAGPADDVIALAPQACVAAGVTTWSPTQVIIAVPTAAVSGPIEITNGVSNLKDATSDARGPQIPDFLVNGELHPGVCAVQPSQGLVGDQFSVVGQGFGAAPDAVAFGNVTLNSFSGWADTTVGSNVPVVGTGKYLVRVRSGGEFSNPAAYTVMSKSSSGPPVVTVIDPSTGPRSEYVTLSGTNFGFSVGTVRFRNKISGQEALGDTAFPAACAEGYWKETSVVMKVPSSFITQGAVTPGDYSVRLVRSDAVESNEVDFVVSSVPAKPGICAISPTVGPIGTPVTFIGERFGGTADTVTFTSNISAVPDSWSNTEVKTKAPTGASTGPARLTVQSQSSNAMNFQVRNCNEQAGICSQNEQCCGNGTCIAKSGTCAAVVQSAMYAWQSSTGLIPVAPRVVEECRPNDAQPPIPSPAPWNKRAGGEQACVTASITMRFTTKIEPTTVVASNFRVKKCTSASTEPCATTEDVVLKAGFPLHQPASQNQDAVIVEGAANFDTDATYLVEVLTGVRGFGPGGANMDASTLCGDGVGYCFRFKTRSSAAPCTVGGVSVAPHPYELNETGADVDYLASPLAADDKCVVLQCDKYNWEWQNGDTTPDGRAVFEQPLKPGLLPNSIACRQVGVAVSETGNVPVHMNATVQPDNIKGTGDLYVKFIPPRVVDYAPKCDQACINAMAWATFNVALDPSTIAGNIEIRQCNNENCIESELGAPLAFASDPNQLTTVPKTSETEKRFLQIRAVDANGALLFVPGAYYRVLLRGGTDTGIRGLNGVPMTGLNHPEGFVWTFRTKLGADAFCVADSVDVSPGEKYETQVGARQLFKATAFGKADQCSAQGQMLIQTEDTQWSTSDPLVAQYFLNGSVDTGGNLPAQCSSMCLALGSQGVFGKVASCGNGIIETSDAAYCATYNAANGGNNCSVLPAGARDAEQCDPAVSGNIGLCDATTCLWKPTAQVGQNQGTCGNGTIQLGEMCDFGTFCMGANGITDMTSCTAPADKAACEAAGGSCSPQQFRGCSPFCRHTGSASAGSTCGNGDIADGEDCDDNNGNSNDGCSSACLHTGSKASVSSVCGNAILEPGEVCEKVLVSEPLFPAGCDARSCLHTGVDLCDNDPNTPDVNCCGNATISAGEDCDDGNKDAGDGCSMLCLLEGSSAGYLDPSFCSDGILETGEQCEVGLPSDHQALLTAPNNAVPPVPPPLGTPSGDSIIDAVQLAYIVGDAEPNANGLMASTLGALLSGKTGNATYGLQCGFSSEDSCSPGYGLTDQGCCNLRPEITTSYPPHASTGVCRNVQISATFNAPMNSQSVGANVQIAKWETTNTCPAGTTQVTDDFRPVQKGIFGWFSHTWRRLIAWATGRPAYAAVWCAGAAPGQMVAVVGDPTSFRFNLINALEANTQYRIKFLGDDSAPNGLSDNNSVNNKKGIKTLKGVVAPYDGATQVGPLTWSFTTGDAVCAVNLIQVTDQHPDHPLLFVKDAETHPFTAQPVSIQNGASVPIVSVVEYDWEWDPWTTANTEVVQIAPPNPGNADNASVVAQNKNGNTFVVAWLLITADSVSTPSTLGRNVQGTAPVTVQLCENPWPSLSGPGPIAPFRDKQPTGDGSDSTLTGSMFENGPFFNLSTTYCRDAGAAGTDDDLPKLNINFVPPTSVDATEGILRQYLFTYGADDAALQKDGIGIRVAANPLHLSPEDWYAWRGFGGSPQPVMVDGYRGLKDGTTTYVAAANTQDPGQSMYSNIYLISHNPDASPVTVGIYEQMVQTLAFNINLTTEVSNICVQGNDPNTYGMGQFVAGDAGIVSCSSDFDCLKYSNDTHCGSFKLKLARDTERLADYQIMAREIEDYRIQNNTYPKLNAGTFLQGFSTTRWNSWNDELSKVVAAKLPVDPVNEFLTCGRCSQSQAVCGANADCPTGETCTAQTVAGATYDPLACWDAQKRRYLCPRVGVSPSHVYQYRALNGGARYELSSEFEVPQPTTPNSNWWVPELFTEIKRCQNADTNGFLCDVDTDCRPCANPKDLVGCPVAQFPVPGGACKPSNGRFVYRDSCPNVPYGQGGTCGDGAIGTTCVGGANNGQGCTQDTDCSGGSCSGTELCEIGQTRIADCSTDPNNPTSDGLKLQVCSECKEFVDDVNITKCDAGLMCGNGRVDKKCIGGPRNNLSCLAAADCPSTPNDPPAICGPTSEVCDDGSLNGSYGHCNVTCTGYASYCGDALISPGESCDTGAQNGQYCSGNCANTCSLDCKGKAPSCGDGIVDAPNEQCDGQTVTTILGICTAGTAIDQPCSTNADCGTGGTCATSGPLASCQGVTKNKCATSLKLCLNPSTTYPGASFNPSSYVVCQEDSDCTGTNVCRPLQDAVADCTNDSQCSVPGISGTCSAYPTSHIRSCSAVGADKCTYPTLPVTNSSWSECKVLNVCGDGILNAPAETCDDGSGNGDTKACTSTCKKNVCGDGKPFINVEECDNGAQNGDITCNADYGSTCASCSTQCKFLATSGGYCGDLVKNGGEQCDGMVAVNNITDQYSCPGPGRPAAICPYVNADCLQSPCQKTKETGITCKSLGFDFATNGVKPKLKLLLDPATTNLDNTFINPICPQLVGMKYYEWEMYKDCLGATCFNPETQVFEQIVKATSGSRYVLAALDNNNPVEQTNGTLSFANPLPTPNEFWACVREKGPAKGIGIQTEGAPELVQCGNSCGFTGCAKCSDEPGTGQIEGDVVDAVYNQAVPGAEVSLFYKGVLVSQTATDEDGHFQLDALNDRAECSLYKLVIDKYDDNPCTGNEGNRPNCALPSAPDWNYPYSVPEGDRGGYWPLTTPTFSVSNFTEMVGNQGTNRIYLFPRPGVGEAYYTVLWSDDWSSNGSIWGGHNNHLIVPEAYAYTAANGTQAGAPNYPQSFEATTCNYSNRPATNNQCVRDVTWRGSLKGYTDLEKLPHSYLVCLHKAGDKVGGYNDPYWNGCPVEGRSKCLQANNGENPNGICTKGITDSPGICKGGTLNGATCPNVGSACGSGGMCNLPCEKEWWDTCDFYKDGPLTTYVRYSAFSGSLDPIRLYWGFWNRSIHSVLNSSGGTTLSSHLNNRGYRAVISTDSQIVELNAANATQSCGSGGTKDCKFWDIAWLDPTNATLQINNSLKNSRPTGISTYEYSFQGTNMGKYCIAGSTMYRSCSTNADCSGIPSATCVTYESSDTAQYQQWSRANY